MELFAEIINGFKPSSVIVKSPILDVWQDPEYASVAQYNENRKMPIFAIDIFL